MKMHNMKKMDMPMSVDMPMMVHYPTVRFTEDELPEIKDWVVGEEYDIVLKVKQREVYPNDKMVATFDILKGGEKE